MAKLNGNNAELELSELDKTQKYEIDNLLPKSKDDSSIQNFNGNFTIFIRFVLLSTIQ